MFAITVQQPWASLVVLGAKAIEVRTYGTPYRGPLAIHASKSVTKEIKDLCSLEPMRSILTLCDIADVGELPLGVIVGVAHLEGCEQFDGRGRLREFDHMVEGLEAEIGDHRAGRWGWVMSDAKIAESGLKAVGGLGLWQWPEPQRRQYLRRPWTVSCATPGCASKTSVGRRARCWPAGVCPDCLNGYGPVRPLEAENPRPGLLALPIPMEPAQRRGY